MNWESGQLTSFSGLPTPIVNQLGGVWNIQGAQVLNTSGSARSFSNAGTVRFTGGSGSLQTTGPFGFTNTGTIELRLGGTAAGSYDRLLLGTVTLGGTLDVKLTGGFVPAAGNAFDVVTYTSRTGTFATIVGNGETYTPAYSLTGLTLTRP